MKGLCKTFLCLGARVKGTDLCCHIYGFHYPGLDNDVQSLDVIDGFDLKAL